MNKQLIKLTVLIALISVLVVSTVSGFGLIIFSCSSVYDVGHSYIVSKTHPTSASDFYSAVGQSFTLNGTFILGDVAFYLFDGGTEENPDNGTYVARLYNATGAGDGNASLPTTSNGHFAEAVQHYYGTYDLPETLNYVVFSFTNITLTAGNYTIAFVCETGITPSWADGRGPRVYDTYNTDVISGNMVKYYQSAWSAVANTDLICTLYASEEGPAPTANPSYTPPPTSTTSVEDTINTFTGYLIPLILFLLPALILGWLTRWKKWPILIGLAIGAGLTYLFLGTSYLWLVILVVIGIGASAYQSSRGG